MIAEDEPIDMPLLPNNAMSQVVKANLERLHNLNCDDRQTQFALRIQNTLANPRPLESIGRQGMQLAAKVLAATAWDFFQDSKLVAAAKAEHRERLAGSQYKPRLEPNQKPPLDYRNPPKR